MAIGIFIIFFVVIAAVVILVPLGIWLGRRARGSIALQVPNRQLQPGEMADGLVHLTAKRNLGPGSLSVSLVCTEEWREWVTDHDGDRTRETRRREAYRHDIDLDQQLAMEAGTNQVFPFALQTPQHRHQPAQQPGSTWGRLVVTLGEMGSRNSEFIWEIESRYDIPGLDLVASERLNLDLEL
jgi:hypothetical protein